jgi:hypothetical protein
MSDTHTPAADEQFTDGYTEPDLDATDDADEAAADPFGVDDPERELTSTVALFEGDEGGLEEAQRRALVVLLKHRFISAPTHPREWKVLVVNPRPIRSRLNDLFLDLVLDTDREVAYKRPVNNESGSRPYPTLLHDTPWGREDTILLVYLRSRFRAEDAAGAERVFVDRADMLDHIAAHRPDRATDVAGDAKRAAKAVETVYRAGLLIGASTGDRFEISRAIEVLLPMEKLQDLLTWLRQQNNPDHRDSADQPGDDRTEDTAGGPVDLTGDGPQLAPEGGATESETL